MGALCKNAQGEADYHLDRKTMRTDHYRFLYSVKANCAECVSYWLQNGADVERGTENHGEWNASVFAEHYNSQRMETFLDVSCTVFGSLDSGGRSCWFTFLFLYGVGGL